MKQQPELQKARNAFHAKLCKEILLIDKAGKATNADSSNPLSNNIAVRLARKLDARSGERPTGQTAGNVFERLCTGFVKDSFLKLLHLRPGIWDILQASGNDLDLARFEQYSHLKEIELLAKKYPELRTVLGGDYFIKPDIVIFRSPEEDAEINRKSVLVNESCANLASLRKRNSNLAILHASISCKWTIRSDRTQNSRSEALNLIRNRKGHVPHIAVVTAEPLPSRLASICLGTGDIDCVYHFALPELREAIAELKLADALDSLDTLVNGKRLRDVSDLPLDLAI
jgi:hypothetical protein